MSKLLTKYRQMRDFSDTPEPAGRSRAHKAKRKLTFVIQKHRASHLHYDFRLEMEGVLKSWAVPKGPSYDPAEKRLAMQTEDHPYEYGSFEGVIPEGNYGAGQVIIWDQGTWEPVEPEDPAAGLRQGKLAFRLEGKKMFGEWALVKIRARGRGSKGNEWLLIKHRDGWANQDVDVTALAPRSVVSDRAVDEIGDEHVWQSNRKASRGPKTMASRVKSSGASGAPASSPAGPAPSRRRRSGVSPPRLELEARGHLVKSSRAKAAAATRRPASSSTEKPPAKKKTSMAKRSSKKGAVTKPRKAAARPAGSRSGASPSRGASVPSRSSRAGARTSARPTARRRPR